MNKWNKKSTTLASIALFAVISGGATFAHNHQTLVKASQKEERLNKELDNRLAKIKSETNTGQIILSKGETVKSFEDDIRYLNDNSSHLDKNEKIELSHSNSSYSIAKKVQDYFEGSVIQDKGIPAEERVLKDGVKDAYDFTKEVKGEDASLVKYTKGLNSSENKELSARKSANDLLLKIYKDNKVVSTDKATIDEATKAANAVKSPSLRKSILDKVEKVKAAAAEEEKAEQQAQAERQAQAEQQAQAAQEKAERSKGSSAPAANTEKPKATPAQSSAPSAPAQTASEPAAPSSPGASYSIGGYATVSLDNSQATLNANRYGWISIADIPTSGGLALLGHADAAGAWVAGSSIGEIVNISGRNYQIYSKYVVGWNSAGEWEAIQGAKSGEASIITCTDASGQSDYVLRLRAV